MLHVGSEKQVNVGIGLFEFFGHKALLHHTAAHRHNAVFAPGLKSLQGTDVAVYSVIGVSSDGARCRKAPDRPPRCCRKNQNPLPQEVLQFSARR